MKPAARRLPTLLLAIVPGLVWSPLSLAERWFQLADTVLQNYGTDQGLPNRTVQAISEDAQGFLWVGTQGGLARWDGYRFRHYRSDPDDATSLPDSVITRLQRDARGRLWIGTSGAGLALYQPARDQFRIWGEGSGLSDVYVRALADDGQGGLWIGTQGGLDHLDPDSGRIRHTPLPELAGAIDRDKAAVLALLRDRRGRLWAGVYGGLLRRDETSGQFSAVPLELPPGKPYRDVFALSEDAAGRLWIGTDQGVWVLEPGASVARAVAGAGTDWINTLMPVGEHEIWMSSEGQGIIVIDPDSGQVRRIRKNPSRPSSLPSDSTRSLYRDRSGLVWIGSSEGLSRYSGHLASISSLFGGHEPGQGLSAQDALSVETAADGRLWVGLLPGGVDILDPAGQPVATLRPDPARPETALPRDQVLSLSRAPDGTMYLGTNNGLYQAGADGQRLRRVTVNPERPEQSALAVLAGTDALWVGSYGTGLWRLDPHSHAVTAHYDQTLSDQRVVAMLPALDGGLWIATLKGLNHLDAAGQKVEQILPDKADPQSLAAAFVDTLLSDRQGRLWVGTLGGGLHLLEGRDSQGRPRFRRFGIAQGLPSLNIEKLLPDREGRIWASADGGLVVIDPQTLAVRTLQRAEGVAFPGYWVGSGTVSGEGELVFGGAGGLSVVRPERLRNWDHRPPVVITDLRVGGRVLPSPRFNLPEAVEPLAITPEANSLAVEFAALDYSAPERNRYAYRLEGYDADWIETDWTRRLAAYTNLPPGDYRLQLRGSNRDGVWSEAELGLPIRVLPAWHQTYWFRLLVAAALLLLMLAIVQSRTAWLRRRERQLEVQVAERTTELQQANEELTEAHRQLEHIAYIDALTHLPNRRLFHEDLLKAMSQAKRRGEQFALLLLDLDRFKQINDTLGHDAGDALLIEAAARFKAAIRESDSLARIGGDEFAMLLSPSYTREGVETVCRRVIESFEDAIAFQDKTLKTSPSIGVALYPVHGDSEAALFKSADLALYAAKRAGRNTWRWHGKDRESV